MKDNRILTLTGTLKVLISTEDNSLTSKSISGKSKLQIKSMERDKIDIKPMKVNEETVFLLKNGLYKIRAVLDNLESQWEYVEIKNGETKTKIFHFGKGK